MTLQGVAVQELLPSHVPKPQARVGPQSQYCATGGNLLSPHPIRPPLLPPSPELLMPLQSAELQLAPGGCHLRCSKKQSTLSASENIFCQIKGRNSQTVVCELRTGGPSAAVCGFVKMELNIQIAF